MKKLKNFDIDKKNKIITVSINPNIFPLEIIYSAAYVLMNDAYVILDGDPKKKILVQIKAKEQKKDLEKLALEFHNELLNYAVYAVQAAKTQEIRKAIVERALMTNTLPEGYEEPVKEEFPEEKVEFIEDPLGIAKPWTPEMVVGLKVPETEEKDVEKTKKKIEEVEEEMKPKEHEIDPEEIAKPWGFDKSKC